MTRQGSPYSASAAAARAAQDSTAFEVVARVGYVVLGVLHIVIGSLAVSLAQGGGGEADQGGAMEQIQRTPVGAIILWAIVVGLVALAIWQIAQALLERDASAAKRWGHRIKDLGTAVAYLAIASTAFTAALGGRSESSESSQSFSAQLLAVPAGVVLLGIVGLVIAAVGGAFVVRGATRAFAKRITVPAGTLGKAVVALGVVGYIAKGVAVGVAGILFVIAAVAHDPETAGGLDAALRSLATLPFGTVVLWSVGVGLALYGLYCFARARYARM